MSIRGRLKFSGFCLFMTFAMLVMSSVLIWCAGQQNVESPITIVFEASKVSLTFAQNDGSVVTPDNCAIVKSADGTQFKIVGPTPTLTSTTASANETNNERTATWSLSTQDLTSGEEKNTQSNNTTQNVATSGTTRTATASSGPTGKVSAITDLANSDGAEFYYFCTNSAVTSTTGYTDPGTIYWTSTADSTLESWYDLSPYTVDNPLQLYTCFMTPNFTGAEVDSNNRYNGTATQIIISNSVENILYGVFYDKSTITNVAIPQSVKNVGYGNYEGDKIFGGAFAECTNLKKVILPNSIEIIGAGTFYFCRGLTSVSIPECVRIVGCWAFSRCDSLNYRTYDNAKYLGNDSNPYVVLVQATSTSITSFNILNQTKIIYSSAFANCSKLTNITIPDSVTCVGDNAFYGCTSLSYKTYSNAKYLGNDSNPYSVLVGATSTSITSCEINSQTKVMYGGAFSNCTNLSSIIVPNNVTFIGGGAFYPGTSNNISVRYGGTIEDFEALCQSCLRPAYTISSFIPGVFDNPSSSNERVKQSNAATVFTIDCTSGRVYNVYSFQSCLSLDTEITCYDEKKKRWYKKKLRDITYKDKIVVWNFDEGKFDVASPIFIAKVRVATRYTLVKLADGTKLKLIGADDGKRHRMFVKETNHFDYVNKSLIGKTTFNEKGEFVKIEDIQFVDGKIEYSSLKTAYHFNCFANGVLTSNSMSDIYKINDMKYVKDNRELRPLSEFEGVDKKYYDALRLAEQPRYKVKANGEVEYVDWVEYVEKWRGLAGI